MWRAGDQVGDFFIDRQLPLAGGRGVAFQATRGTDSAFLKLFLSPRVPKSGSSSLIAEKTKQADAFARRQHALYAAIKRAQISAPNLSVHLDFFAPPAPFEGSFACANAWLDLQDALHACSFSDRRADAATILAQVADALLALHGAGVVHGDVKLENVGVVAGADGWVAKVFDYDHGWLEGAPRPLEDFVFDQSYSPPESLAYAAGDKSQAKQLGSACDVYSFAHVCIELWAGARTGGSVDRASGLLRNLSVGPRLARLLEAALSSDHRRRCSLRDLHDALREGPSGSAAAESDTPPEPKAQKPETRSLFRWPRLPEGPLRRPRITD